MNQVLTLTAKDLRLLVRDKFGLFWVFVFPLLYAALFAAIFGGEGGARGKMSLAVIDEDQSDTSRAVIKKLSEHESIDLKPGDLTPEAAARAVRMGDLTAFVVFKKGFGDGFMGFSGGEGAKRIQVGIDPARQAEAGLLQGVLMQTVFTEMGQQFTDPEQMKKRLRQAQEQIEQAKDLGVVQKTVLKQFFSALGDLTAKLDTKDVRQGSPFNQSMVETVPVLSDTSKPRAASEITFPSAVLWGMLSCMTGFAVSIVVERTHGTLLRLRIAPNTRGEILAGKGLACFLTCCVAATAVLFVGRLWFHLRVNSPLLLAAAIVCAAFCFAGLMMFLAVLGKTEQAVGGSASALMVVMAMLGGGMIPLIAMPQWMQTVSNVSPVKWGIYALEGAIWREFTAANMLLPCAVLLGIGAAGFGVGTWLLARQEG